MSKTGVKHDSDKPRWGLLPYREVRDVVDVLTFGSKKYADDNWKYVDNAVERYYDAMMRHLSEYRFSKERDNSCLKYDNETGKNHLAHAICCALFIMWFDNEEHTVAGELSEMTASMRNSVDEDSDDSIDADCIYEENTLMRENEKLRERVLNLEFKIEDDKSINESLLRMVNNELERALEENGTLKEITQLHSEIIAKQVNRLNALAKFETRVDAMAAEVKKLNGRNDRLQARTKRFEELSEKFIKLDEYASEITLKYENELAQKDSVRTTYKALKEVHDIQVEDGNWNYDPYMHGMANGLILAVHILSESKDDVPYLEKPRKWLSDVHHTYTEIKTTPVPLNIPADNKGTNNDWTNSN